MKFAIGKIGVLDATEENDFWVAIEAGKPVPKKGQKVILVENENDSASDKPTHVTSGARECEGIHFLHFTAIDVVTA